MFTLPYILPADPRAPEHVTTRIAELHYGVLARLILTVEGPPSRPWNKPKSTGFRRSEMRLHPAALAR